MIESELRALLAIHETHTDGLGGGWETRPAAADGMCSLCFASVDLVEGIRGVLQTLDALRAEYRRIPHD
jgi:hypothetical protein